MGKILSIFMGIIALPLTILNIFGAVVAGIWLGALGEWSTLLAGLAYMAFGAFIIGLMLAPTLIVALPMIRFAEKKNVLGVALVGALSIGFTYLVFMFSSMGVYGYLSDTYQSSSSALFLVWFFAVAISPWTFMASKEKDNEGTWITLFISQSVLLLFIVLLGVFDFTYPAARNTAGYALAILSLVNVGMAVSSVMNGGESLIRSGENNTSKYYADDLQAYVIALIWIAAGDSQLRRSEIVEIKDSFHRLTGERISQQFIKNINSNIKNNLSDDELDGILSDVDPEIRPIIFRGACRVAGADSDLAKEEKVRLATLAEILGISKKEASEIISQPV